MEPPGFAELPLPDFPKMEPLAGAVEENAEKEDVAVTPAPPKALPLLPLLPKPPPPPPAAWVLLASAAKDTGLGASLGVDAAEAAEEPPSRRALLALCCSVNIKGGRWGWGMSLEEEVELEAGAG